MLPAVRVRALSLVAALVAVAGSAAAADAGWVTIQNDTQRVVVVQTTVTVGGQAKRGRPVRLLPGETLREFHDAATLTVEVFDGRATDRSLFSGALGLRPDPQTFRVAPAGTGVTVTPGR